MKANWIASIIGMTAFAACTLATPALANPQPVELIGDVKVEKVVVENGKETRSWIKPQVVVPGDRLTFSTQYRNTGANKIDNFVVTNPIPTGVMLAPDGAATLDVSVDGGKTWGKLGALQVADGKGGQRAALHADVTHVRWTLPVLNPGTTGALTYNAIVR